MKIFRLDGGGKFCNTIFQSFFFYSKGIAYKKIGPYTPEQNGVTERKHCHIVEITMSLIFHSFVSLEFWSYAFSIVVFLLNWISFSTLNVITIWNAFWLHPWFASFKSFWMCMLSPSQALHQTQTWTKSHTTHIFRLFSQFQRLYLLQSINQTIFLYANSTTSSPSQSLSKSDPSILLTLVNIPHHTPSNSTSIPNIQSPPPNPHAIDVTCSSFMDSNATS